MTESLVVVKNIKKEDQEIPKFFIDKCKELGVDKFIPIPYKSLTWELHNTYPEVANAFRRCINSELPTLIMDFDLKDIDFDDVFLMALEIQKRINLIPIRQISGMNFSVDVYNNTNDPIKVMSSDIKQNGKSTEELFSQSFIIAILNPRRYLKINNIKTKSGAQYKDGAAYSYPERVQYECIDLNVHGDDKVPSSLHVEQTSFRLSIQKQQYELPTTIIKRAAKEIEQKLDKIYDVINNWGNTRSTKIEIKKEDDVTNYKIYDETYTVGQLIVRFINIIDPSIELLSCFKKFSFNNFVTLKVGHIDANNIVKKAIKIAKLNIKTIGDSF